MQCPASAVCSEDGWCLEYEDRYEEDDGDDTTDGGTASCTIYTPAAPLIGVGSWYIAYYAEGDAMCAGELDGDDLWDFYEDGTIANHWLGIIDGYSWRIEGDTITITMEAGFPGGPWNQLVATVSKDCQQMECGTSLVYDASWETPETFWTGTRRY